ncbi:site-specific integrase [bacterium]|nr:site-specific integrase [bacterium]
MAKNKQEKNLKFIKGKNGKPGYYVTDITLNWKRIRRYAGRTKEEAKTYLGKLRIAAKEGTLDEMLNPQKHCDTFGEYSRGLLNSAEWKEKRSASRNERSLKYLNRMFKDVNLSEINPGDVRKYITERRKNGLSPATINRELSLLKSILYAAEYDGLIESNPIRGRRIKRLEENNSREKKILDMKLTDEDLRRLIDCASPYFKPILQIALVTGMRRSEILKMKWNDINFRLGTIYIPKENSKSKQDRTIPIDSYLFNILDSIERKGDYVFMNDYTGERRRDVKEAFKIACKKAGIKSGQREGLTFHDLRHLAAYRIVKLTDIVTASKILGHSTIQMTMRYVHPTEKDKKEAIEKASENLIQSRQNPVNGKNSEALKGVEKQGQIH